MQAIEHGEQRVLYGWAWRATALGALLLAVGCGDSAQPGPGAGSAGQTQAGVAGATGGTAAGASGSGQGGTAGGAPGTAGANEGGSAGVATIPTGGGGSTSATPSRLDRYHHSSVDGSLHFELDAVEGLEPYPESETYLTEFLGRVLNKPDGIFFDVDASLPAFGSDKVWTFPELSELSRNNARDDSTGPVSIHVIFLDGQYDSGDDSGTILGLAWGQRYIAIFQDALRSGCAGLGGLDQSACKLAERSVWAHEIGHVIGLVDNGLSQQTPHKDAEHGAHDESENCLMYWAYERPALFDTLLTRLGGSSADIDFCENCWADLDAARQ